MRPTVFFLIKQKKKHILFIHFIFEKRIKLVIDDLLSLVYTNLSKEVSKMQKEDIIQKLREQGFRITKQRRMLIDIILGEECSCCKEIYYKASKIDSTIGTATVYRMINTLEDIGAISRNTMYKIAFDEECPEDCTMKKECQIELEDGTMMQLTPHQWEQIVASGLQTCGYTTAGQGVKNVMIPS